MSLRSLDAERIYRAQRRARGLCERCPNPTSRFRECLACRQRGA